MRVLRRVCAEIYTRPRSSLARETHTSNRRESAVARVPGVVPEIRIGLVVDKVTGSPGALAERDLAGLGIDVEKSSDRFPFRA